MSAVRRGIFVDRQPPKIESSIGATSSLCRSYGAKSESKIGCYKYSAPDGAAKNKCIGAFLSRPKQPANVTTFKAERKGMC